jgi:menaquinone-9 beta-reductase
MVNPFNGEGIAYAIESAELAALAIAEAHRRGVGTANAERSLESYPRELKAHLGGYYTLGRAFVKLIGKPSVMKACTTYGLPHKTLMRFVLKLMANLTDSRDGDAMDKIINSVTRIAPAA